MIKIVGGSNLKFNYTKIKLPILKEIIMWLLIAIIFFKIKLFSLDLSKYIFIVIIVILFMKFNELKKILKKIGIKQYLIYFLLGLVWTIGLIYREIFYSFNSNSFYISSKELLVIFLYIFVFPMFIILTFKNINRFEKIVSSVAITQSLIIISSLFLTPVKTLLSLYYNQNAEYLYYISASVKGVGIGVVGASGAIVLFSVQVLLMYMMIKGKIKVNTFLTKYIIIMVAEAVSGRTAFYCSILLLIYWLVTERRNSILYELYNLIPKLILCILGVAFLGYLIDKELIIRIVNRSLELFYGLFNRDEGVHTFNVLKDMSRPKLTLETLFGTSVTKGVSSLGTRFQNDSGYWQKFFALGLIGSIAYYLSFLQLYLIPLFQNKLINKSFYLLVLAIMLLIEIKEPFFSYLILPMVLVIIMNWEVVGDY